MESKRRRMIRTELDRLLGDEGTRNLLSGIKIYNKNKKLGRIVTRNKGNRKTLQANNNSQKNASSSSASVTTNSSLKTKKIIKKSLSLLGHHAHVAKRISNGIQQSASSSSNSSRSSSNNGYTNNNNNILPPTTTINVSNNAGSSSSSSSTLAISGGGINMNNSSSNSVSSSNSNTRVNRLPLPATSTRDHVGFITLAYQSHLCTLNNQDLKDLTRKLEEYESKEGISVIVINSSSDRIFCDGFDYKELILSDLNKRKLAVQQRIQFIKNFVMTLAKSKKLLVASLNSGKVSGFGLLVLGLFDLVYANDKATFSLQKYLKLGQPPEGISIFNESQLNSPIMKGCVYSGRAYTASEMLEGNLLVTELLWDASYHEQLAVKLQNINSQKNTKFIYKTYSSKSVKQLSSELNQELSFLESVWVSDIWQTHCQRILNNQQ